MFSVSPCYSAVEKNPLLISAYHHLLLQSFIVEILPVQHGNRIMAGDAILDDQGCHGCCGVFVEQHVVPDAEADDDVHVSSHAVADLSLIHI